MIDVALLAKSLQTALAAATLVPCGLGDRPLNAEGGEVPFPIQVLQVEPGTVYEGPPMGDDHGDAAIPFQLDIVGRTYEQVLLALTRARRTVADRDPATGAYLVPLLAAGMDVQIRELNEDSGVRKEAGLWQVSQRFAVWCFATGDLQPPPPELADALIPYPGAFPGIYPQAV